ncbi:zinc finger BED domain-containing protein 6-like [Leptidea sinapis]|uniref:zinc finger BED domain-containing protein 6-like n=1 Tax=Leptidea sinapis TaxID=189913 RepID=UPI0021C4A62E|nr:zinc finger BED domain-containing protein 6-like [Leptidea sinapis]
MEEECEKGKAFKSLPSSERLKKTEQEELRLIQCVETRWNSIYYMLKRFIDLEEAIRSILGFVDRSLPTITSEDWILYAQLCQILRPFEEITSSMSGDKYLTGSSVIVVTRCLIEACQKLLERTDLLPEATDTILLLKTGLKERFKSIEQSGTFSLATFMDPRFKMQGFSDQNEATKTKEKVRKLVAALIAESENTAALTTVTDHPATSNIKDAYSPWNIFDKIIARCNIVATSVPCERMFTKTGSILSERRTRLTTSKVAQIMFLNVNSNEERFREYSKK